MKLLRYGLLIVCLLLLLLPAAAQDTETIEWGDLGLEVDYDPDFWAVDDSGEDALVVLYTEELAVFFYEPWEGYDNAEDVVDAIRDNENFDFGDVDDMEVMGEEAFRVNYESEELSGFSVVFEFDEQILVLDALVVDDRLSSRDEEDLLTVVDTLRPTGGSSRSGGGDAIESFDSEDPGDIVDELIDLGLVSDDGDMLFEEETVTDKIDAPESYEGGNIAMGALISWEVAEDDEEYRACGLIAQSKTDDLSEGTLLVPVFDMESELVIYELDMENSDDSVFEAFDVGIEIEDPQHLLMILENDTLSVYVNGELAVEGWELDSTAGNDELFAGVWSDLGCVMTTVWAYTFE